MSQWISLAAGLVGVIGYAPYVKDIVAGTTQPDRTAWTIWSVLYALLFATQLSVDNRQALWLPGLQLAGVLVVAGLSMRYGSGSWTRHDSAIMAIVAMALILWRLSEQPLVALLISLAIEAVGVLLIIRKTYADPDSETLTLWLCIGAGSLLGIVAIGREAAPMLYIYPVVLAVMNFSVVAAWLLGKRSGTIYYAHGYQRRLRPDES